MSQIFANARLIERKPNRPLIFNRLGLWLRVFVRRIQNLENHPCPSSAVAFPLHRATYARQPRVCFGIGHFYSSIRSRILQRTLGLPLEGEIHCYNRVLDQKLHDRTGALQKWCPARYCRIRGNTKISNKRPPITSYGTNATPYKKDTDQLRGFVRSVTGQCDGYGFLRGENFLGYHNLFSGGHPLVPIFVCFGGGASLCRPRNFRRSERNLIIFRFSDNKDRN